MQKPQPPVTIILDIDGTLLYQFPNTDYNHQRLLHNTLEKLKFWESEGYNIVLISGRRQSARKQTERQLAKLNIDYDQLILGVGPGPRVLVNDMKQDSTKHTAYAVNLVRNYGIGDINIKTLLETDQN